MQGMIIENYQICMLVSGNVVEGKIYKNRDEAWQQVRAIAEIAHQNGLDVKYRVKVIDTIGNYHPDAV